MVQAIIMAGGEGSRLRPLTCDRPKPMVPVLNRPVMEYAIELLKKHGIRDIGVTLQYMPKEITEYFGDGSDRDMDIRYFIEETPLGTAGSVKNAAGFLKETFIVVSGDALTDFNLSEAINFHRAQKAVATLVLTPVEIPLEYGVVITGKDGRIRRFLEKPGWGEVFSDTVNTGIYILEPEVLNYIPEGAKYDFSKDLFPQLLQEGKSLCGVSLRGYWCDIGNLKQYREAHYDTMEGRVNVNIELSAGRGRDGVFLGDNCQVDSTAVINGPVFIGNDTYIGRDTVIGPHVVLGSGCRIDAGASLKRSVVWNRTYIGKQAEIRGAVICDKVTVKDRAMVFEGAVIGDGAVLEEDTKIKPDTGIWPQKTVEKGKTLDTHLVWGTKACRNLFGIDGISGRTDTDLTPECAARLGAVFGTVTGTGSNVLISSDHHRGTQVIKMAVQSGLMSVGTNVIDGGSLIVPVHRNSIRALGVNGGVHIKSSAGDPEMIHLNFFSGSGAMIPRDLERKIENLFERDDFRRRSKHEVGALTYVPGLTESYMQKLFSLVNADIIRNRRYKAAAYFTGENLQMVVPYIFNGLGCHFINYGAETGPDSFRVMLSAAEALAGEVNRVNANFGVVFDSNAEHVVLIDETGRVINEDMFLALMSLIILETSDRPLVAVPVTGSGVVENMAESRQGRVIRTKTAPAALFSETLRPEITAAQGQFNQSVMTFDALSTVVRIMDYMALRGSSLGQVLTEIPEFHMTMKETDCPWNSKGKVMRRLIEETGNHRVELLDGVKVHHDHGWALVLPDAEEPRYRVYSEGASYEFAESLADFYIERINQLRDA